MRSKDDHNVAEPEVEECEFHYSEDRDERVKDTGEVFTPPELINKMLKELDVDWSNPPQDKTFLDPTCGSGNFLVELAKKGIPPMNIYGVDLMQDNVDTTHKRLTKIFLEKGNTKEDITFHLNRNVVQGDALTYSYDFWQEDKMDAW